MDDISTEQSARLLQASRDGDAQALSELLRRQQPTLLKFIAKLVPAAMQSRIGAEDVVQDAFFLAFRRIGTFTGDEEDFGRWLATIARHCLIDHVRAQQAGKRAGEQLINADPAGSMVSMLEELGVYLRTPSQSAAR